jgi:hypothetical protein
MELVIISIFFPLSRALPSFFSLRLGFANATAFYSNATSDPAPTSLPHKFGIDNQTRLHTNRHGHLQLHTE